MTVEFIKQWNGYEAGDSDTFSAETEADLVRLGFANSMEAGVQAMFSIDVNNIATLDSPPGASIPYSRTISSTRPNFEVSGTATETEAGRIQIPGGLMKANSALLITTLWQLDGNDSKNLYMRAGNDATTVYSTSTRIGAYNGLSTQKSASFGVLLYNNGSTVAQIVLPQGAIPPFGTASTGALILPTIDTTLDWSIYLGAINSVAGAPLNKCILKAMLAELK